MSKHANSFTSRTNNYSRNSKTIQLEIGTAELISMHWKKNRPKKQNRREIGSPPNARGTFGEPGIEGGNGVGRMGSREGEKTLESAMDHSREMPESRSVHLSFLENNKKLEMEGDKVFLKDTTALLKLYF